MKKRILSILLCVCMLLSFVPQTVFAYDGSIFLRSEDETLTIDTNTTVDSVTINGGTLIIASGVTLTVTGSFRYFEGHIENNGTINCYDGHCFNSHVYNAPARCGAECAICGMMQKPHAMDPATGICGECGESIAVAKIGDTFYSDVQVAVNNAQDNDTVVLLQTVTGCFAIAVSGSKSITLNLNGFDLRSQRDGTSSHDAAMWINCELNLINTGSTTSTVEGVKYVASVYGTLSVGPNVQLTASEGCEVRIIESGVADLSNADCENWRVYADGVDLPVDESVLLPENSELKCRGTAVETLSNGETATIEFKTVSYNVWVGGVEVTSKNTSGEGWSYDRATKTLSLNNATITGHYNNSGIYSRNSLNIVFEGNNKIVASPDALNYGIRLDSSDVTLNISGNGNLDVSGHFDGINVESGSVTISGGLVKATGTWSYGLKAKTTTINGTLILAGGVSSGNTALECADVTFGSNAHVMVHNDAAAKYAKFVTQPGWQRNSENISFSMEQVEDGSYFEYIGVGHATVTAANDGRTHTVSCGHIATFTENHSFGTNDECVCGVEAYDLWVGGQQFTSEKLTINSDTGTATFNPATNTLTLNNFSHTSEGYKFNPWMGSASIYATLEHLTVNFVGSNTVACSAENGYALYNYGALTITTDDTNGFLALTGDSDGIWVSGNLIINGCQVNATGIMSNGTIAITNSFVTANGARHGIAVVHAEEGNVTEMKSDDLTITNSTVVATGGEYALFYDGGHNEEDESSIRGGLIPKLVFDNKFAAVAGSDAESAVMAAADAAATYENKHVRIVSVHDVTYKVDGEVVKTLTVEHGKDATAPEIPAKTGYTAAWSADGKNITTNTEINAVYTINQYTITFDTDGGSEIPAIKQDYGTAVTAPAAPTKTGYTFAGWDVEIPATMPAENVTIKAKWNINKYTVTYKADGQVVKTVEVEYGKDASAPEIPTKEGYDETAPKWDVDGKNITSDITINAIYTKNQPGEYADVTPDTNVGGGKFTESIDTLKDKLPISVVEERLLEMGYNMEVRLEIKDISASVPAEDKSKIDEKLGDADVAMYLDISMYMEFENGQGCQVKNLNKKTQIRFELDDSLINTNKNVTRTYGIIHVHDGVAEVIEPTFDAAAKTLSFMTDRFSTYAVVYTDGVNTPPTEETVPPTEETVPPTEATTPPTDIPATGDSFDMMLWATMLVLSAAASIVLLAERKRLFAKKNV